MTTNWTGKSGNTSWFTAGNWSAGAPHPRQHAAFQNGNFGAVSLANAGGPVAQSGLLSIDSATLTLTGGALRLEPIIGGTPQNTLDLQVTNAALSVAADTSIIGAGRFEFRNVSLTLNGALRDANATLGGTGDAVTLSGSAAVWSNSQSFYFGAATGASAGTMRIERGAHFNASQVATIATGTITVTDAGSSINAGTLEIGNGAAGDLIIANGAHVHDFAGIIGNSSNANVLLTGAGSSWTNANGLLIGDHTGAASLTVTDGARIDSQNGIGVDGILRIDGTAQLTTNYLSLEGGTIIAEPPPGQLSGPDVTISTGVFLFGMGGGLNIGYLESLPGARLVISGAISDSVVSPENLQIATGTVVLENANNSFGQVQIGAATLDLTTTGAAGGQSIAFIGAGTLQVEAGVSVTEPITGFQYSGQTIDLASMAFGNNSSFTYLANTGTSGGTLTVTNGVTSASFVLTDYHNANDFAFQHLSHSGGTQITYQGPTQA